VIWTQTWLLSACATACTQVVFVV